MPFLLLDDATDEATRRLHEFGQGLLQPLQPIGQTIQQAGATVQPGPQVVPPGAAIPNAQAAAQRLQDYGSSLLQPLIPQAPTQIQEQPGIQDITQRLQDFGQQHLDQLSQQAQQLQTQTTQLLQPPQEGQIFGPGAQTQAQQQAQAQVVQTETPRGGDLQTFARQVAQKAGIDPDIFVRQIQQESGFNPNAKSPAGAIGIAQFMPGTAAGLGIDPTDAYAALEAAAKMDAQHLAQYGGDWAKTLAAYNAGPGAVDKYGGVPPFAETQTYVKNILGGAQQAVQQGVGAVQQTAQNVAQGAQQAVSNVLPTISQFGDKQLTAAEAYAACGPAAAVRFAQMMGRNPTLQEAIGLAQQVGWTVDQGMAGLGSESRLFDKMNIPHRMVGADWNALAKEAQSGNPVTMSTPGHYFTADNYDPQTGAFHVGSSGTDLKGGSEWMTPAQMEARMGKLQGGMAVDNPQVPGPSPLASGMSAVQQGLGNVVQGARQGLQDLTAAVPPGQVFTRAGQGLQAAADVMPPGSPAADITRFAGQALQAPSALDAMQTVQDLNEKYSAAPSAFKLGGQVVHVDPGDMSPDDAQRYNQAAMVAGATSVPPEGTTRMFHGTGADFPRVDPFKLNPESLYGPGYYLTSDPRVAGGVVRNVDVTPQPGDVESVWGNVLNPATNPDLQRGAVVSPGYAQAVQNDPTAALQATLNSYLRRKDAGGMSERMAFMVDQEIDRLRTEIANAPLPSSGPNVRAVDVPRDLNLLDVTAPADQGLVQRLIDWLDKRDAQSLQNRLGSWQTGRWEPSPGLTNEHVYRALSDIEGPIYANKDLAEAGFDGITHEGGARMPMPDETGQDIRHTVNVIFPESLHKVSNAVSGTLGGAAQTGFAAGLGGAVGLGALAANRDQVQNFLSPVTTGARDLLGQGVQGAQELGSYLTSPQSVTDLTQQGPMAGFRQNLREVGQGLKETVGPHMPMGVLDSMQTLSDLNEKYAGTAGSQTLPIAGERVTMSVDPSVMTPEDAQAYKQAMGSVAGVSQADVKGIRTANLNPAVYPPRGARGPIANLVDVTKQFMLSGPPTHVSNTIGNTIQLLKSPVALALGGRPRDAWAGVEAVGRALPEAFSNSLAAAGGTARASLATPAGSSGRWYEPVFRALSASDAFTRTLAEYQGMAEHASHLLSDAGIKPNSPRATPFLMSHAAEIADQGRARGSQAVFMADRAAGTSRLDQLANLISNTKEGLLASPKLGNQALGALLDTQLPFLGVPTRILQVGSRQLPGISQASTLYRMTNATSRAEAQRALGEGIMETAIQLGLAYQIAQGNIRGPDDPDHPNEANIMGNWVNLNNIAGAYALPAQIMAAAYEGYNKPLTSADQDELTRVGNALNSSIKPLAQAVPGLQMMHFLASLGSGAGLTGAAQQEVSDTLSRIAAPGLAKFGEDVFDPTQRDIAKQALGAFYEPTMARIPGLAERLPARIDLTTGEPMEKRRAGAGVLLGVESYDESPFREVANDLAKKGYDTKPPTTYPNQVSIAGSTINLKPDEQRQVAQITGQYLGNLSARVQTPEFQNADDSRQAAIVKALLDAQTKARESAVAQVLGRDELRRRILAGTKDTGRLANQAPPVLGNLLGNISTSLSDQLAGAGVSARP